MQMRITVDSDRFSKLMLEECNSFSASGLQILYTFLAEREDMHNIETMFTPSEIASRWKEFESATVALEQLEPEIYKDWVKKRATAEGRLTEQFEPSARRYFLKHDKYAILQHDEGVLIGAE